MSQLDKNSEGRLHGRQRLAWAIVLASFFACAALTVTIPVTGNAYLQNATRQLTTVIQANQGTVGVDDESGPIRAVFASDSGQPVAPGATILTDTTASALLLAFPPEATNPLARLQISGNTTLVLRQADAPRFNLSRAAHWMNLDLQKGRVRVVVPEFDERPLTLQLTTPQGITTISEPGQYSIQTDDDATQVTVLEAGQALIEGAGQIMVLSPGQRGEMPTGAALIGPLNPARNLVRNGDFSDGLHDWVAFAWQVEREDQPQGTTEVRPISGDPTLRFIRDGIGHADVQLSQTVNQDVSGYSSVQLQLTFNIVRQSLDVCGSVGSECPLFIRIGYIDEGGINRTWQHGFYSQGVVDDNATPGACTSCAVVQQPHDRVSLGQLYYYEVALAEALARQGFLPPRFIESITLIASGHSFETEVSDVGLIVEE